MNWLRRLFGLKTDFEVMLEHVARAHQSDLELIRAQHMTLDRIVTARYDRPTIAPPEMQQPNLAGLVDLNVSDEEFLERTN